MRRYFITRWRPTVATEGDHGHSACQQPAADRRRCVTDGGRSIDSDEIRAAVAPAVFAVDEAGTVIGCSDVLATQTATDCPVGSPLSSLLSVADTDLADHLLAVSQTLETADATTVTSDCVLRTAGGRQSRTVEFTTPSETDDCEAWLVGVMRPAPAESTASQPQPTGSPDRFRRLFEQLQDPVVEVRFSDTEPIVSSINGRV